MNEGRKDGNVLFNDIQNILFNVIWHQTYHKRTIQLAKKHPLLLIRQSSPCSGGSGFPFLLYELSVTICPTPYNRIKNVSSVWLNKTFPSFLLFTCV